MTQDDCLFVFFGHIASDYIISSEMSFLNEFLFASSVTKRIHTCIW